MSPITQGQILVTQRSVQDFPMLSWGALITSQPFAAGFITSEILICNNAVSATHLLPQGPASARRERGRTRRLRLNRFPAFIAIPLDSGSNSMKTHRRAKYNSFRILDAWTRLGFHVGAHLIWLPVIEIGSHVCERTAPDLVLFPQLKTDTSAHSVRCWR
jgi:hypothetical protein